MALSKHGVGGCATSRDAGIAEGRKLVQRNIVRSGQAAGGMQELSLMVHGQNTPWRFLQHFGGDKGLAQLCAGKGRSWLLLQHGHTAGTGACVRVKDQLSRF